MAGNLLLPGNRMAHPFNQWVKHPNSRGKAFEQQAFAQAKGRNDHL